MNEGQSAGACKRVPRVTTHDVDGVEVYDAAKTVERAHWWKEGDPVACVA